MKALFPSFYLKIAKKEDSLNNIFRLTDLLSEQTDSDAENTQQIIDKVTNEESLNLGFFTDQLTALKMFETAGKCFNL